MTCPVTHAASSLTSQPTRRAASCGVPAESPWPVSFGTPVDAVHGDAASGEVRRERRRELAQGGLGRDVRELARQHTVVLPGGEDDHAAAAARVETGSQALDQQEGRPCSIGRSSRTSRCSQTHPDGETFPRERRAHDEL
jgi:hypothetical protein